MGIDDELRRAGQDLVERSGAHQTPQGLRHLHRRRRRAKALLPVAAALLAGVVLWPNGNGGESSVDTVDAPRSTTTLVDQEPARLEFGRGPTTVLAADGTPLITLDGEALVPLEDDLALAVTNELLGIGTGAGSSASAALTSAGLAERPDDALAQLGDAGLVIETTIDVQAQEAASAAIDAAALPPALSTALWSIDPSSGATMAVAGPAASIRVQASGAIRPAMMAAALEAGVPADERLDNPSELTIDFAGIDWLEEDFRWEVQNPGRQGTEPVTLGEALAIGANTPWAGLIADGRIDSSFYAEVAERFGFHDLDPVIPATVLGVFSVDPVEVVRMTAVFATDGSPPAVHMIRSVRDRDDRLLFDRSIAPAPVSTPIVDPATLDAVRDAMAEAVCCGAATGALLGGGPEQIGIGGSMPQTANAWFAGSTPELTTAVWVGSVQARTTEVEGLPSTGGGAPAAIWADYTRVVAADGADTFPR